MVKIKEAVNLTEYQLYFCWARCKLPPLFLLHNIRIIKNKAASTVFPFVRGRHQYERADHFVQGQSDYHIASFFTENCVTVITGGHVQNFDNESAELTLHNATVQFMIIQGMMTQIMSSLSPPLWLPMNGSRPYSLFPGMQRGHKQGKRGSSNSNPAKESLLMLTSRVLWERGFLKNGIWIPITSSILFSHNLE